MLAHRIAAESSAPVVGEPRRVRSVFIWCTRGRPAAVPAATVHRGMAYGLTETGLSAVIAFIFLHGVSAARLDRKRFKVVQCHDTVADRRGFQTARSASGSPRPARPQADLAQDVWICYRKYIANPDAGPLETTAARTRTTVRVLATWRTSMWASTLPACGSACWATGYALTDVAPVRSAGQVEPVFTLLLSRFYLREPLKRTDVAGLGLVAGGFLFIALGY